jgi:hypothetical protein
MREGAVVLIHGACVCMLCSHWSAEAVFRVRGLGTEGGITGGTGEGLQDVCVGWGGVGGLQLLQPAVFAQTVL